MKDQTQPSGASGTISPQQSNTSPRRAQLIAGQMTVTAEAFGTPMTAARIAIYVQELSDVDGALLNEAFRRARSEQSFFPTIAQIRDLAGMAQAKTEAIEADEAWVFVCDFLREHGKDGQTVYVFDLEIPRLFGQPMPRRVRGNRSTLKHEIEARKQMLEMAEMDRQRKRGGKTVDGYVPPEITYQEIPVPAIPARTKYALRQLASDVRSGLRRIEAATALDDPKEIGFVRKEFVAAYLRGAEVERRQALQLSAGTHYELNT